MNDHHVMQIQKLPVLIFVEHVCGSLTDCFFLSLIKKKKGEFR